MKDNIPLQGHQMVHFDICLEKKNIISWQKTPINQQIICFKS